MNYKIFLEFFRGRHKQSCQGGMKTTQVEMGDDRGVCCGEKEEWKMEKQASQMPWTYIFGGWEVLRGGILPGRFWGKEWGRKALLLFFLGGGKGVSKYLHVFFGLNPFPNILEKCFYVKNKCSILWRKWSVLKRRWKIGRKEEREIWLFGFGFVTLMYW